MRLPDFLVIGAQKCATTDLCWNLGRQSKCFFSTPKELNFFCCDDADILPYPLFESLADWIDFDWELRQQALLQEYANSFDAAPAASSVGEGTPVYLYSARARERIRRTLPNVKIVVIMRDPVERAWSAYWHHVRIGRATLPFGEHLLRETSNTLRFGRYLEALVPWYEAFPHENILPLTFEQYVGDRESSLRRVCAHIGVECDAAPTHSPRNSASIPLSQGAQLAANRVAIQMGAVPRTIAHRTPPAARLHTELVASRLVRGFKKVNQFAAELARVKRPRMEPATRERLVEYYRRENRGLDHLTGLDLSAWSIG